MAFGLLNIDKPSGLTSHDVVQQLRRLTRLRRIGHTGTLDPLATGVLVLCLGRATRLVEYIQHQPKLYQATLRLGQSTSTYDAEGEIVAEDTRPIQRAALEAALPAFRGHLQQIPPMYSAIKIGGEKLYQKARRGEDIERPARAVSIFRLHLDAFDYPYATLTVRCSAGTYIRSLAQDLGQALGVGAHLTALRRLAVGENFTVENAVTLEAFAADAAAGRWQQHLLDVSLGLSQLPRLELENHSEKVLRNGGFIALGIHNRSPVQAWSDEGEFIGVLEPYGPNEAGDMLWKASKIFPPEEKAQPE